MGLSLNEMRLSTGFMIVVTSFFVPDLCSDQDNKGAGTSPPTKITKNAGFFWCLLVKISRSSLLIKFIFYWLELMMIFCD